MAGKKIIGRTKRRQEAVSGRNQMKQAILCKPRRRRPSCMTKHEMQSRTRGAERYLLFSMVTHKYTNLVSNMLLCKILRTQRHCETGSLWYCKLCISVDHWIWHPFKVTNPSRILELPTAIQRYSETCNSCLNKIISQTFHAGESLSRGIPFIDRATLWHGLGRTNSRVGREK